MKPDLNILARFHSETALIADATGSWLETCSEQALKHEDELHKLGYYDEDTFWAFDPDSYMSYYRPYKVRDGILHIPIKGVLTNNLPYTIGQWATGYEYIKHCYKRGMEDADVKGIALMVDSIGGKATGCFDLVNFMFQYRGRKPVTTVVEEKALSAGYAIASVADRIVIASGAKVGSIGVAVTQVENSKRNEAMGITVNLIRSKPRKMEGNPWEALTEEARARIQADVNTTHEEFVALVARNRSLTVKAVDDTDALTFMGGKGVEAGLADEVLSFDDAIAGLSASQPTENGGFVMAENTQAETVLKTEHDAAVASASTAGHSAGWAAALTHVKDVLSHDAAKTRPSAAMTVAMNPAFDSTEKATAFLATLPEEAKAEASEPKEESTPAGAPAGMLEAAMGNTPNPEIGADTGAGGGSDDPDAALMSLIGGAGLAGFQAPKQ